jgi:hypothetical protein
MKKIFIPILAATAILTAASCSKKSSGPSTPQAQVMYFNGWLAANTVNVTAGGTAISNANNLAFLKNTGYQNVTAGTGEKIAFVSSTTSVALKDTTVTLTANNHYSVFLAGISPLVQVVTADDLTAPASGMAKVRFVNLSPDTVGYNVYVGTTGNVATNDTKYGGVTAYTSIGATASANVLVSDPNSVAIQTVLANQSFSAGKIYTIVLTGLISGSGSGATTITIVGNN